LDHVVESPLEERPIHHVLTHSSSLLHCYHLTFKTRLHLIICQFGIRRHTF